MSILTKLFGSTQPEIKKVEQPQIEKLTYKQLVAKLKAENKDLLTKYKVGHQWGLYQEMRSKHIAYCMLRGTPFEKIESKWRDPKSWINISVKQKAEKLLEQYKAQLV